MVGSRPQVVAHRGASHDVAEHTLGAYLAALDAGAEGVECDEELRFAREIGCEYVQGFYVARPAPADQLQSLDRNDELAV